VLTSPFLLAKHASAALDASGEGRFVVTASAHALVACPYTAAYVSAKPGVLGPREDARARGRGERHRRRGRVPLPQAIKRLIEPEEVAEAVAYLLGPGGRTMTGVPLTMDLGWSAR
jgi:3-hydroxybutyrate dehydrogenase